MAVQGPVRFGKGNSDVFSHCTAIVEEYECQTLGAEGRLMRDVLLQVRLPCQHLLPKLLQAFGRVVVHAEARPSNQPSLQPLPVRHRKILR